MADKWSAMLGQLVAHKKKFGTTDVSSRDPDQARLGRWVAAQRHKRRKGKLSPERIRKLNAAGMIWSPGEISWTAMFMLLKRFAAAEGHCNIPEHYPENQRLASWAHNQRYRKRRGELLLERRKKLEGIGFQWSIYKEKKRSRRTGAASAIEEAFVLPSARMRPEERLYMLKQGMYVQFNGGGRKPETLMRYERTNGELPPYIPLPRVETVFYIGEEPMVAAHKWRGSGGLPRPVLDYVNENGCLPRHS